MTPLKVWKNEWYTDLLRTCWAPLQGDCSALLLAVFRWTRRITWARRRYTGLPAAVTCRPAGCYWAPAPTRCCHRSRDYRRLSSAMRACRRYCRVSWRTVVGGSLLWAFIASWTFASVLAEGVLIGNSEVDRQLLEASKTGDLETVKVGTHSEVEAWSSSKTFNFKMMMTTKWKRKIKWKSVKLLSCFFINVYKTDTELHKVSTIWKLT